MEKATISVVMPIFNTESYLEESINSVLNQDYADFELILVDDGSVDNCPEIVDDYAHRDQRVISVHQPNMGLSGARNTGIERARGKYIYFIDSDDFIEPVFLRKMIEAIESDNADMAVCGFIPFGTANPPHVKEIESGIVDRETAIRHCLGFNSFNGYVWNKIFRLSLLTEHNLRFENFVMEDILFTGKYIYYCSRIAVLSDKLYHYHQNPADLNRGRYSQNRKFDPKCMYSLNSTAILRKVYNDPKVSDACTLHDVREAGIILRSMSAGNYKGPEFDELQRFVRQNAYHFCKSDEACFTQKISVFLTCISPALELMIWRALNKS